MPDTTITIDCDQRDGLYELVRNHLGGIGDVWIALEDNQDYAAAERLAREFAEDFRLLGDIGWRPSEDRESFELTIPADELAQPLKRLHGEAERILLGSGTERESREDDQETSDRYQLGLDACEEVLVGIDARGGESA
jgi:hypothetical protein